MADRVVRVRLSAVVGDFNAAMEQAANKTRTVGTESEKLAQKKQAFQQLGAAGFAMGGLLAAGVSLAVARFADFDAAMSSVQAATHESAENMDALREAALKAGSSTVFTATEAAAAVEELAKAGISTADILGGALDGALDLAAAGNIEVADAAEIAASAMTQFGLEGRDVAHIADLLAAGAGKAQGGVSEMSQALNQSGLVAAQMGLSLDDTVGTLTQFASAGLLGSDAGTSFRNMLLRLANPTGEASAQMKQLKLNFYDAQGEFVGIEGVAAQLQSRLSGLTQEERNAALANLFGQDAIRSASILYEGGAAAVRKWADEVNDAGYASETAALRLDNLKGDWEAFTGALDTALITMGEGADGPMRAFVQTLTDMVSSFSNLPDGAQHTALGIAAVTSAVGLGVGGFLVAVPKIAEYRDALATMGTGAQRAGKFVSAAGKTAAAVAGFLALTIAASKTAEALQGASDGVKGYQETLKLLLNQDVDAPFAEISTEVSNLEEGLELLLGGSFNSQMERFGSTLNGIVAGGSLADQVSETREQFSLFGQALAEMVSRGESTRAADLFDQIAAAAEKQGLKVEDVKDLMPEYQEALDGVANQSSLTEGATDDASDAIDGIGVSADDAQDMLDGLRETLKNVGRTALDMGDAQDQAQSAINSMVEAAEAEGASLWDSNDASIAFRDSIREVEESGRLAAESLVNNGLSADEATAAYRRSREAILDQIQPFFESRDAAAAWAEANLGSAGKVEQGIRDVSTQVNLIPTNPSITIGLYGAAVAISTIQEINRQIEAIDGYKGITVGVGGGVSGLAGGGPVTGPGAKGVDSELRLLAPGEHVITSREVDAVGGHGAVEAMRAQMLSGSHSLTADSEGIEIPIPKNRITR